MKSKKHKVLLVFCLLTVLSIPLTAKLFRNTDTLINKISCRLIELNRVYVSAENGIDISQIEIKQGDEIIFKNEKRSGKMLQEYGHAVLDVYYKSKLVAEIGHFKTNNWYTNDYSMLVSGQENDIHISYRIDGPSSNNDSFLKLYTQDSIKFISSQGEIYRTEVIEN